MQTSAEWWERVRDDRALLIDWLQKQHHGERTAAERIRRYAVQYAKGTKAIALLEKIAFEEELHAVWVGACLRMRGVQPIEQKRQERYWNITLPGIKDLATGSAVAAHAEAMRLERIRVIAADYEGPRDVRETFAMILPMEVKHEKWFRSLSTPEALAETAPAHNQGSQALGLINIAEAL